jgi:hypothetical protein
VVTESPLKKVSSINTLCFALFYSTATTEASVNIVNDMVSAFLSPEVAHITYFENRQPIRRIVINDSLVIIF